MSLPPKQQEVFEQMRDILGEDLVKLHIISYKLEEDFETDTSRIKAQLVTPGHTQELRTIEGEGRGMIDACFHSLLHTLAEDYPSLKTISFNDFRAKGLMSTKDEASGADAQAQVTLTVSSSEGHTFTFESTTRSIARASIEATLEAINYFVTSEKAFIQIYRSLEHYRKQGRSDLVTKYQLLLGQMVQNTSYTEVIEQIKADESLGKA